MKLKIFKSAPNEECFNFYLYSIFGVVVIIASPRRWSVMNVSCWQIPPGLWFNLLSYGMRTKWTIFQACKYVTNDSARTIDSNHSDTMFHSQDWLWLYKLLASWTVNPCTTRFNLDQSSRIFVSVFASNLNKFPKWNGLLFFFYIKRCYWVSPNLQKEEKSRRSPCKIPSDPRHRYLFLFLLVK